MLDLHCQLDFPDPEHSLTAHKACLALQARVPGQGQWGVHTINFSTLFPFQLSLENLSQKTANHREVETCVM